MRGGIVMSTAGTVPAVSRWYRAMSWMLIGHLFTTITFDMLGLDLILPAIAGVFQALGLRALRRENRWFARAYPCMVLLAVYRLFWLLAGFTIWYGFLSEQPVIHVLSWGVLVLRGVVLFLLWKGVREAAEKAGIPGTEKPFLGLLIWYMVIVGTTLLFTRIGFPLSIGFFIVYGVLLHRAFQTVRALDDVGFLPAEAELRPSDAAVGWSVFGLIVAGFLVGYFVLDQYPMHWTPRLETEQAAAADTRQTLLDLGYPQAALADLAPEYIAACKGAADLSVEIRYHRLDGKQSIVDYTSWSGEEPPRWGFPDGYDLAILSVAVRLPDDDAVRWRIFHHFIWLEEPDTRYTDALRIHSADESYGNWSMSDPPAGRLLIDRSGHTETAEFAVLEKRTTTSYFLLWGTSSSQDWYGGFSFPADGSAPRGYLTYSVEAIKSRQAMKLDSDAVYHHQRSQFMYPVCTAVEAYSQDSFGMAPLFDSMEGSVFVYLSADEPALVSDP